MEKIFTYSENGLSIYRWCSADCREGGSVLQLIAKLKYLEKYDRFTSV